MCVCALLSTDLDVLSSPDDTVCERAIDQGLTIERQTSQDPQGCPVSWQCADSTILQASGVQVQERAVHFRQLLRGLSFSMVRA